MATATTTTADDGETPISIGEAFAFTIAIALSTSSLRLGRELLELCPTSSGLNSSRRSDPFPKTTYSLEVRVTRTLCVVVAVLGLTSIVALGQAKPDPKLLMGTWKLNVEKSKYTPGPGPKSQTLSWKMSATGFDFTVDSVNAEGKPTQQRASGNFEGKPYAFKGTTFSGMRTSKWVDGFTVEEVDTADGKVRASRTGVISKDGKILTVTGKGTNAQGQPANNTSVYEKQANAVVETAAGRIRGYSDEGIHTFKGIPYASPPTGALRFMPPEPPKPWTNVRNTLRYGPACPQATGAMG